MKKKEEGGGRISVLVVMMILSFLDPAENQWPKPKRDSLGKGLVFWTPVTRVSQDPLRRIHITIPAHNPISSNREEHSTMSLKAGPKSASQSMGSALIYSSPDF